MQNLANSLFSYRMRVSRSSVSSNS